MQHHSSVRESAQSFPAFSIFIMAMVWTFHDDSSPAQPSSSPEGALGPGAAAVRRRTQVRGMEGGGWKSPPLPMEQGGTMCPAGMKPRFLLPDTTQGVSLTEMTQVLNADLPLWSPSGWFIVFRSLKWHLAISTRAGRRAMGRGVIGHDHCSALEEWHMRATASPQPFSKCLCRSSHKSGCIDLKMQSKAFEPRPYLHHLIRSQRARCTPGREGTLQRVWPRPFCPGTGRGLGAELGNDLSSQGAGCLSLQRKPWPWLTVGLFLPLPSLLSSNNEALSVHHGHGYARLCRLLGLLLYHAGIRQPPRAPQQHRWEFYSFSFEWAPLLCYKTQRKGWREVWGKGWKG